MEDSPEHGEFPALPDEVLPTLLQSLELRGRPLAAVGKAWRAAVRELRHAVPLVAGGSDTDQDMWRLRPLYPPSGMLVTAVSIGPNHTAVHMLMVTGSGTLLGRGYNHRGQLGLERGNIAILGACEGPVGRVGIRRRHRVCCKRLRPP